MLSTDKSSQQCKTVKNFFGKDILIPSNWDYKKYEEILIELKDPIDFNNNEYYELITVKRRNQGLVQRCILRGKAIKTKNLYNVKESDFIIAKMQIIHGACGLVPKHLSKAKISGS